MTPRGIRNNNPGNIEYHDSIPWRGQTGSDGRFATFDTAHNGIRALAKQLIVYQENYGLRTVRGIINRWAPPSENDTGAYVNAVARAVGVGADQQIDLHDSRTLAAITTAIIQHENGQQPYTAAAIAAAVADALGVQDSPVFMERERAPNVDKLPANIQEPKTMGGLAAMLVQTLIGAFAPLAQDKINSALAKRGVGSEVGTQLVGTILNAVQPGLANADPAVQVAAVAKAQAEPATVAKAEAAALDLLATLGPLADKIDAYDRGAWAASEDSMDRAAARGVKAQEAGLWGNPQFIIAAYILSMVGGVVFTVLYRDTFSTDMQSFVIGAIVGGALTAVISFFFGTSRSSAAKDVVIGELAARR